jgi:putative phosphoribosyl transferase
MKRLNEPVNVSISVHGHTIYGDLTHVPGAKGVVIFAHGSGSSRFSRRNKFVAHVLQQAGLATLLFDLLTPEEEQVDRRTLEYRFDVALLAERLLGATDWISKQQDLSRLRIGYFGASTGAAAAVIAAALRPALINAVVSRGGRPDLAGNALPRVAAPTLLIVGELDPEVIELNRQAANAMEAPTKLAIVPGATHLFEEPRALEQVALLAKDWYKRNLIRTDAA